MSTTTGSSSATFRVPPFDSLTTSSEFFRSRSFSLPFKFLNSDVARSMTGHQKARDDLSRLANFQRQVSTRQGLRGCGIARISSFEPVQVRHIRYAGGSSFACATNVQTCNSWMCVRCSARMAYKQRVKYQRVFQAVIEQGFELDFGTFTVESEFSRTPRFYSREQDFLRSPEHDHYKETQAGLHGSVSYTKKEARADWERTNEPLSPNSWEDMEFAHQAKALGAAMSSMLNGSFSQKTDRDFGVLAKIHAEELIVHPGEWVDGKPDFSSYRVHLHTHVIFVRDPAVSRDREGFYERVKGKFVRAAQSKGVNASVKHQDVQHVQINDDAALTAYLVSSYPFKQLDDFGFNLSNEHETEEGKGFTQWGLVREAFAGNHSALELWWNLENARKSNRAVVASPKMLERLGLSEEDIFPPKREPISDEVVAELPIETVVALNSRPQAFNLLFNMVENTGSGAGVESALTAWGLPFDVPTAA